MNVGAARSATGKPQPQGEASIVNMGAARSAAGIGGH
jgi:hypothetical protein